MSNTPTASPSPAAPAPVPSSLFPLPSPLFPLPCALPQWCVVLPAYNEEDNLTHVVDDVLATFERMQIPCRILIVDDGSIDRTPQIADAYAARLDQVAVVHHSTNLGFGEALKTGYAAAEGDLVVVIPTDRQFRCEDLSKCLPHLHDHDIVSCVRRDRRDPALRRLASATYRKLVHGLFGLKLDDINWVKIYRTELIRRIEIESQGPFIDTEILVKAHRLGAQVKQVDVPHYPRIAGKATGAGLRAMAKTFLDLFRLWHRLRSALPAVSPVAGSTDQHPASSVT